MLEYSYIIQWSSGLFGQVSCYIDLIGGAALILLPLMIWTIYSAKGSAKRVSTSTLLSLLIGTTLLVIANDVLLLMAGAATSTLAMLSLSTKTVDRCTAQNSSTLTMSIIGWSFIFAGLAWLIACAAIARSAPHGLPGMTTINLSELVDLIRRSALQHPAAKLTWEQYQLVPTTAIFIGVAVLSGLFPFHGLFVRTIEQGSLATCIWAILISKVVLLLFYRLLIAPDPASWATTAELFTLPALFGFVYVSYLMYSGTGTDLHFSRLIVWSQQLILLGWILLPETGLTVLWLSSLVQFSGFILLSLVMEYAKGHSEESFFIPKLIGVMSVGTTTSVAGLFLVWDASLQLSTSLMYGAAAFVLFAIALLISIAGLLNFVQRPISEESPEGEVGSLRASQKWLLICWSMVTILGSFLTPYFASLH